MRIAQVSPLYESVPPKLYGGTERVVSYLTEALVGKGYDVTLFASGDSVTRAKLVPIADRALRLEKCTDPYAFHVLQLEIVLEMADKFDIIHFHTDYFHFPVSKLCGYTHITTLHGRLDLAELDALYQKFTDIPVVSISLNQRKPLPGAGWVGNVYHGIPENYYNAGRGDGGYAAFLGRVSPEKRVDRAIEIALKAGLPIKIAAKVDKVDVEYFEQHIRPLLNNPGVEFIGEIGEDKKNEFMGNARVTLFPIDWPEPFGLVMVESIACGTPVVAFSAGSVPEIIDHGKSGYVVSSVDEAVAAVKNIDKISRDGCRQVFMDRFTNTRMADDYIGLYKALINGNKRLRLPVKSEAVNGRVGNALSA